MYRLTNREGTAGLGAASIQAFAKHNPAHIYFTGRNAERAHALIAETKKAVTTANLTFIECDLASLASIQAGMQQFTHPRLDILVCNAGVMSQPPGLSKDGYEIHFAVNHLGNALVVKHLLPTLLRTAEQQPGADVRIVLLSSEAWRTHPAEGVQFATLRTAQDLGWTWHWRRYGQSKLANILYAAELARRFPSITTTSLHPGVVNTKLLQDMSAAEKAFVYVVKLGNVVTPETGVLNQLWAAAGADKADIENGAFYMPVGVLSQSSLDKVAKSRELATQLWEWTDTALDAYC